MSIPKPLPGLNQVAPYIGGESEISGIENVIKLSSNEGAFGPSSSVREAIKIAISEYHRYPDGESLELRKILSTKHNLEIGRIVCGCGSDELINLLCRVYAGPGDQILCSEHGFAMYPIYARTVGAIPIAAAETNIKVNVGNVLNAVTENTKLVFIANPNNPTGTYLSKDEINQLHSGLPKNVLLVIDCAYAEYVTTKDYSVDFNLVQNNKNVAILRTFSKIYGMGGVRLGWGYFSEETADILNRVRSPFNVSYPAQVGGIAAINDEEFVLKSKFHNSKWLEWTIDQCRSMGLSVPDSNCNFAIVRFEDVGAENHHPRSKNAHQAAEFLKSRGLIVRLLGGYGLPEAFRVTIGLEKEMRAFINSLQIYME